MNGHNHGHAHPHPLRFQHSRRRLFVAFVSQFLFFVVELVGDSSPTAWPCWRTPATC